MFVLNFVISGKVTSLQKLLNVWKEINLLSTNFSAKHTPSATLISLNHSMPNRIINVLSVFGDFPDALALTHTCCRSQPYLPVGTKFDIGKTL